MFSYFTIASVAVGFIAMQVFEHSLKEFPKESSNTAVDQTTANRDSSIRNNNESININPVQRELPFSVRIFLFTGGLFAFFAFNAAAIPFLISGLKRFGRIPFVPTSYAQTETIFTSLLPTDTLRGKKFVDLGSGDGRVVIEAARNGFHATGFELNPWLYWHSCRIAKKLNLHDRATFKMSNFWKSDISGSSVVMVFAVQGPVLLQLREKLEKELEPGAYILSNYFQIPGWEPIDMQDNIWLYQMKSKNVLQTKAETQPPTPS